MAITIKLNHLMLEKKMPGRELAQHIGITEQNFSLLKNGKIKGIRIETLDKICQALDCQPGDILVYEPDAD